MIRRSGPIAIVALVIMSLITIRTLVALDWDATIFVAFGEEATPTREYAESKLGDVFLRAHQGHDGKFFFVQANDPWLLEPSENAKVLDLPAYRSQRMLYPMVAGGLGLLSPEAIVWGLLLVNIAAMALGTLGTAEVAQRMGGSKWLGLAFVLNIGLLSVHVVDGAGILAMALAIWALVAFLDDRIGLGLVLLTGSVLSREVMFLVALGVAVWLWRQGRRRHATLALFVPGLAAALWRLYLLSRLGSDPTSSEALGLPFVGLARAIPRWLDDPVTMASGLAMLLLLAVYTLRAVRSGALVGWAFLGFVPLAVLFTDRVWARYFDFTRAIAPLITAFVILLFAKQGDSGDPGRIRQLHSGADESAQPPQSQQ